ncbi:MAG: hypothetical protein K9W42_04190 [Candidatus Heimdallarchaeota archaeon]|nr:hypothetical protein [Candidatus Heimdallarchaeota archaeon]
MKKKTNVKKRTELFLEKNHKITVRTYLLYMVLGGILTLGFLLLALLPFLLGARKSYLIVKKQRDEEDATALIQNIIFPLKGLAADRAAYSIAALRDLRTLGAGEKVYDYFKELKQGPSLEIPSSNTSGNSRLINLYIILRDVLKDIAAKNGHTLESLIAYYEQQQKEQ